MMVKRKDIKYYLRIKLKIERQMLFVSSLSFGSNLKKNYI